MRATAFAASQPKLVAEEAPYAYKDVSRVVEACEGAGLSRTLAKETATGGSREGMRSAASEAEIPARPVRVRPGVQRTRVVINRVDPWTVFKVSLLFYFCVMLIFMVAMVILFSALRLTGLIDTWSNVLAEVTAVRRFEIDGRWLFWRAFVIGVAGVVVWSLINFVVALLYNRISDIIGGIKVTMTRRR